MAEFCIQKGNKIFEAGAKLNFLAVIEEGSVSMELPGNTITLSAGDVIGLLDLTKHIHSFSYVALEDTVIDSISCTNMEDLTKRMKESSETASQLFKGFCRQLCVLLQAYGKLRLECNNLYNYLHSSYEDYCKLCLKASVSPKELPGLADISHLSLEDILEDWQNIYYSALQNMFQSNDTIPYDSYPAFYAGVLMQGSKDFQGLISNFSIMDDYLKDLAAILITEDSTDFFDLYTALILTVAKDGSDTKLYTSVLYNLLQHTKDISCVEEDLYEKRMRDYQALIEKLKLLSLTARTIAEEKEQAFSNNMLTNSLDTILNYARCPEQTAVQFKRLIKAYKALPDKSSTADDVIKLRRKITSLFYEIYQMAFLISATDPDIPPILRMFFNFGYVDEDLAGFENAIYLYSISKTFQGNSSFHVYTIWEWLMLVYSGQKEPRKNEFDLDYPSYIADQQRNGKLSPAEAKEALEYNKQKLIFEIANMFQSTNKITYGRISTFCPVFSEHNVIKSLEDCLTTPEKAYGEIVNICKTDFSAFCRPALYGNNQLGINREYIETEFLPDIVLLPNVGTRGVMWQEIEGKNRLSPATFLLPIFSMENLSMLMIRLTAEFRWELCRRIQGARWNDVTEHSLTGNYYDYLQFYKKNNDLSPDMKEKISIQLKKCKNNFKEYFILDYSYWILFEGKGAPKLNRIARSILMDYCPFPKDIRETLQANPMYEGIIRKWDLAHAKEVKRFDAILFRCHKYNVPVPQELMTQKAFLDS